MKTKITLILIYIIYLLYKKYKIKHQNYDIVLAPGGMLGFYTLGICHYIKNNYNINNKKIIGFSAGSFNIIFMSLKNENNNEYLSKLFNLNIRGNDNITDMIMLLQKNILLEINFDDLLLENKSIGLTSNSLKLQDVNSFNTTKEIVNCCVASSFIPFITYNDFFYFYKGKDYYDGGIMYHFLKRTLKKKCLIISYKMFNRWKNCRFNLLKKKNVSIYDLYMLGYHDATNNKALFDSYLL